MVSYTRHGLPQPLGAHLHFRVQCQPYAYRQIARGHSLLRRPFSCVEERIMFGQFVRTSSANAHRDVHCSAAKTANAVLHILMPGRLLLAAFSRAKTTTLHRSRGLHGRNGNSFGLPHTVRQYSRTHPPFACK